MKYNVYWTAKAEGTVQIEADTKDEAYEKFNTIPYDDLFKEGNGVIDSDSDWDIWAQEVEDEDEEEE